MVLSTSTPSSVRHNYGQIAEKLEVGNLIQTQLDSFAWFCKEGLRELFDEINPITDYTGKNYELRFLDYEFGTPKYDEEECRQRDMTFSAPLRINTRLHIKTGENAGEIKETEVFMGDFPMMTPQGTFIVNGTERVVVSQLVRSPGVYFTAAEDRVTGRILYSAKLIPNRGAWLEIETSNKDVLTVKIDRKRKVPVTTLVRALGYAGNDDIRAFFADADNDPEHTYIQATLEKDATSSVDHFANRRIRSVGELIQNQVRVGLSAHGAGRARAHDHPGRRGHHAPDADQHPPGGGGDQGVLRHLQLSQFMDQNNPLSGWPTSAASRRSGPGGLSRERAGFEVRDVHTSHYGRMCPIETPEGPNIGLIGSLATYARVNEYGFIETPYRKVVDGKVTDEIVYLAADEEEEHVIAQANAAVDDKGTSPRSASSCAAAPRHRRAGGRRPHLLRHHLERSTSCPPAEVDLMDVSPKQIVSVSTALIPFVEHDDANRALMGANMQKQAVPLLVPEAPYIGTGIEARAAPRRRRRVLAEGDGHGRRGRPATTIVVEYKRGVKDRCGKTLGKKSLPAAKFRRSNQNTCINQKPSVDEGQKVGPATCWPTARRPTTASWRWARTCWSPSCRGRATTTRTPSSCPSAWCATTC
jgi:DNA-directed RNA polymerase beta subunit